jgi:hypothetical protein
MSRADMVPDEAVRPRSKLADEGIGTPKKELAGGALSFLVLTNGEFADIP